MLIPSQLKALQFSFTMAPEKLIQFLAFFQAKFIRTQ